MPNEKNRQIFKSWVPYWLILVAMFLMLIPVALVLGIYSGGITSAASYYGVDAMDVNYSVVIYYFAIASSFPLEARFFNFFSSKPYFIACCILFMLINLGLYFTQSFAVLMVLRFIGGMTSHGIIGTMFSLVFRQFHEQRSRVLGYATMYAALFSSAPLAQLLDAFVFANYSFNTLFIVEIFATIPGIILMFCIMRNDMDLKRAGKIPLKLVRWESFVLYASFLSLAGYVMIYGQYYHWFQSPRIILCTMACALLLVLFVVRQFMLAEPYIDLRVYKNRNFKIGMFLLILFYISKGDMSLLNQYYVNSLHMDSYYLGYVNVVNAVGIIVGALLAARFVLAGMNIRLIWVTGFTSLLIFHVYALLALGVQAEVQDLLIPQFFQGFGNGSLILSVVIFYVTAVAPEIGTSASVSGVAFRSLTFTGSIALTSFFGLRNEKIHHDSIAQAIRADNPMVADRLGEYRQVLELGGANVSQSHAGATSMLGKAVAIQDNLLFVRDYYLYMTAFIILIILGIAVIPHFHYHIRKIGSKLVPI